VSDIGYANNLKCYFQNFKNETFLLFNYQIFIGNKIYFG